MMKKKHEVLREIFYSTNPTFTDSLKHLKHEFNSQHIVSDISAYFSDTPPEVLKYPAKSYVVALVYSHLMEEYFNIPQMDALNDPMLLGGDDPCFTRYSCDVDGNYDRVLPYINVNRSIQCNHPAILATKAYFEAEFLIGTDYYNFIMN